VEEVFHSLDEGRAIGKELFEIVGWHPEEFLCDFEALSFSRLHTGKILQEYFMDVSDSDDFLILRAVSIKDCCQELLILYALSLSGHSYLGQWNSRFI